ncbi:acyl-coenzyme A diphosphatase NUDT19-like [Glandiceps talaboti]
MANSPDITTLRECASVIIAARSPTTLANEIDYSILLLKRHSTSSFLPDTYVFPGGILDESDISVEWLQLFKQAGVFDNLKSLQDIGGKRPPIFATKRTTGVPGEIALRICAIREAFEEAGLLLVKPNQSTVYDDVAKWSDTRCCVKQIGRDELEEWRKRVHDDATQFINLCRLLQCVPNVWALSEWSNWVTPVQAATAMKIERYDNIIFLCCLDEVPGQEITPDDKEIVISKWIKPKTALEMNASGKTEVISPQHYELLRILNFTKFIDLCQFNGERGKMGVLPYLPKFIHLMDGFVTILPGDSLYSEDTDHLQRTLTHFTIEGALEERERKCHDLHRNSFKITEAGIQEDIVCNIRQLYGHVSPVDWKGLLTIKGKL